MDDIMISVLTTAYNHAPFIRETMDSILAQKTDFRFELLIHDDASTDGTADIIQEYAERYPDTIHAILQTENQYSQGKNVYEFFRPVLRGKYVAVCEGDDFWCDEHKLQKQVEVLEQHPEYAACVHQTEQRNCDTGERKMISDRKCDGVIQFAEVIQGGNRAFQLSSLLVRKQYWCDPNPPAFLSVCSTVGDYPFSIYLVLNGTIFYLNQTMSVYRYRSAETAWSSRMRFNREMRLRHNREMITMLKMVDEYSERRYHLLIEKRIHRYKYALLKDQNDKAVFLSPEFHNEFKQETIKMKCILFFKAWLPEKWITRIKRWRRNV